MYRHEIVDKRGVPQEIDGHTYFSYVSSNNGVITADVYHTDSKFIASESNLIVGSRRKLYNSHEEVKSVVQDAIEDKIRRDRKYTANDPNALILAFPEQSYFSRRITRYTTLPTLEIATKEEGYVLDYLY